MTDGTAKSGTVPDSEDGSQKPAEVTCSERTGTERDSELAASGTFDAESRSGETEPSENARPDADLVAEESAMDAPLAPEDEPQTAAAQTPTFAQQPSETTKREGRESHPDDSAKRRRVNPFSGASQFFSIRGFLAAASLFLLTLVVCVLALDFIWALAIALLFTIAVSTGHLVFYTRDRQVRERVYFAIVAIGAFCGGSLVLDLQLTHPYFIRLREFHQATRSLEESLAADIRFADVTITTRQLKTFVADFSGTVQKQEDLQALRLLAEEAGFWIGEFEVTVSGVEAKAEDKTATETDPVE